MMRYREQVKNILGIHNDHLIVKALEYKTCLKKFDPASSKHARKEAVEQLEFLRKEMHGVLDAIEFHTKTLQQVDKKHG